jgi:hypothetical protein
MSSVLCHAILGEGMSDSSLNSLLSHPEAVVPICLMLVVLLIVLAINWRRVAQIQADAELKRSMIERGMS